MAGDPTNARIWEDADVYVAFDPTEPNPADGDTAFGPNWSLVGLLDPDDRMSESREEDVADHYAWGGLLIRTTRRNFKVMRSFTALERNNITDRLMWPGSTVGGDIVVPSANVERVKVAFERRDDAKVYRVISAFEAEITVAGDINEGEDDISGISFMATIYPSAAGVLFNRQEST